GGEPGWQDPLEPYKPALAAFSASLIPGLNSYVVLSDPKASTASKVFAVGTDVLSVVGVGTVIKLGAKGVALGKGVILGGKVVKGVVVAEDVVQLGGSYRAVRAMASEAGLAGEVHHMPSWAATRNAGVAGITQGSAPSIWMEKAAHRMTPSFRSSATAQLYRAEQTALLRRGRYLDALKMDIEAIREVHGTTYDGAIQQLGEYVWTMGQ
ncbi:MAG: hypothetical protein ACMG6S_17855, partial [Byssovorax sp.]